MDLWNAGILPQNYTEYTTQTKSTCIFTAVKTSNLTSLVSSYTKNLTVVVLRDSCTYLHFTYRWCLYRGSVLELQVAAHSVHFSYPLGRLHYVSVQDDYRAGDSCDIYQRAGRRRRSCDLYAVAGKNERIAKHLYY